MVKRTPRSGKPIKPNGARWIKDNVQVSTGLPPQVDGQLRCFCKVSIPQVVWTIPKPPELALVRVKWWGEDGAGTIFRPLDVKKGNKAESCTTARYPVRSGPCQFATYLDDMGNLTLELLTGPSSEVKGQANIPEIRQLTNTRPINGFYPVISPTGQKLANLQVSVMLEPLMASYDHNGSIPTTDPTPDTNNHHDSMVEPESSHPMPYATEMPKRPPNTVFISPAAEKEASSRSARTHHMDGLKQQLNYGLSHTSHGLKASHAAGATGLSSKTFAITASGDVVNIPGPGAEANSLGASQGFGPHFNSNNGSSPAPLQNGTSSSAKSNDLLSVLVDRGNKLREAMIISSLNGDPSQAPVTGSAALAKSPCRKSKTAGSILVPNEILESSKSAVDLLMTSPVRNQDFQLYQLMNGLSPGTSLSSDMGYDGMMSDLEDPLHEKSILQELFYYNSDNEGLGFSDLSGLELQPAHLNTLPAPRLLGGASGGMYDAGNQRPPSRASSVTSMKDEDDERIEGKKTKTKRKARSRSRSGSRSRSNSRSRSRTPRGNKVPKSEKKEINTSSKNNRSNSIDTSESKKGKVKRRARSRSTSRGRRGRSSSLKRKNSVDYASDSDQMSTARSESSRVSFDPVPSDMTKPKQEGLSVERLTLLGRVHVARVSVEYLDLVQADSRLDSSDSKLSLSRLRSGKPPRPNKTKKPCTYFVEYQFPVIATSRDKYTPNAMATEVTRVASKNLKNGAVQFNHRCVFPIMFDGAAVEKWWKSALVFRLYSKEPGQGSPTLIGSGGVSLKSILRSENLFVQRDIEIPDTSKSKLLNTSKNSSLNSSMTGRSNTHLFGHLKVSVELASDHKDFATVLARTKLAEMSGGTKMVPIGGPNPERARLVEQLNQNKDQPVVKSSSKKIDLPFSSSNQTSGPVTGLPPQSPRRKTTDVVQGDDGEEEDEISRLKKQLKAALTVLSGPEEKSQPGVGGRLDSGAQLMTRSSGEPNTLHTLLYIQEGRNFTMTGIPPLHMANRNPTLMQPQPDGRDGVTRNSYLVCRMFWCNDAVHSSVCWGTLNPEFNFLQVAPVLMTESMLERMRDNYMIVEVWDKKVSADTDKLVGMVKLSLHQFYLSFRDRRIANALLKSEYPVMAVDNYMPVVDLFSGLHYGQLKVVLAMGSEHQIATLQKLALDSCGIEPVPQNPSSYLERQDLKGNVQGAGNKVVHQFEVVIEGLRGLQLFEDMMWGEADCFVQFFFPAQPEEKENGPPSLKSLSTMQCYRTATTLCIPDPTFHDTSRHRMILPAGTPVQRELLTACANSGEGVSGLPFEVWCRYYHPNVRDQLIAKSTLPLAKLCAMVTMHKPGEASVQSFPLRLSHVEAQGKQDAAEVSAKSRDAGTLDVTVHYKSQVAKGDSSLAAVQRNHEGSQVCLSVGVIKATGLKAAADYLSQVDSSMAYPADVGLNAYVRIKISFLGVENERMTKTVARSFCPEFNHYLDFPCPLLMSNMLSGESTSLAELLESAEATFEVWHQMPTGIHRENQSERNVGGVSVRRLAHSGGDILLGTTIVPLMALLTRRTGVSGWFALNLPSVGWAKPVNGDDAPGTALDQVVGGLELSLRFAHQDDRDRVVSSGRSVGWSPIDLEVEQPDWQDEDSHQRVHHITIGVDQVSFPASSALLIGQSELPPGARCYIRYKFYDKGAVVSKSRRVHLPESGHQVVCSLKHKHNYMLSHTAPLQWYLREERLEIQAWVTYGKGREGEKKPRQRDKLIGSCYIDVESLTDMRRRQQRVSGLYPLFKPGTHNLKGAFIRAHITSRVSSSMAEETSDNENRNLHDVSASASETDQSCSDGVEAMLADFTINKSPKKKSKVSKDSDPEASFTVLLAVERAMHLPLVTEKNRSGEVAPSTYISYQSAERSKPTCGPLFANSTNPIWDYAVETRLSTEYLHKQNKHLVLKVWHKPADAPKTPDKSCDKVLGFVSVDLSPLTKGLQQLCGWYNIMDFNGQCRGQIKVSITPQEFHSALQLQASPNVSAMMPSVPSLSFSLSTSTVAANIAQQLAALQQQVMLKMGSLTTDHISTSQPATDNSAIPTSGNTTAAVDHTFVAGTSQDLDTTEDSDRKAANASFFPWQPRSLPISSNDDPSKSFLFTSLRRQLADLDSMTQRLKTRLTVTTPASDLDTSQPPVNSARSGDILTGTHSGLSTIHTASSLMNTNDSHTHSRYNNASSSEVATSQESARSHTMNASSTNNESDLAATLRAEGGKPNGTHKLLDSGVFSAKNFSEKSADDAPDTQRSDRNEEVALNLQGSLVGGRNENYEVHNGVNRNGLNSLPMPVSTLEAGFLAVAGEKTQTILPTGDYSESSGNSHGFVPGTQRSTVTAESMSTRNGVGGRLGSKVIGSGSEAGSKSHGSKTASQTPSGSGSVKSEKNTNEGLLREQKEEDYDSKTEEEEDDDKKVYGSYHRYRQMLDEEEDDDGDDEKEEDEEDGAGEDDGMDVVEIVPRSLNNMSSVLAVSASGEEFRPPTTQPSNFDTMVTQDREGGVTQLRSELEKLTFSPASPNVHEGTSVWCSDDNEDSFFQQVFEKNKKVIGEKEADLSNIDSWLQKQVEEEERNLSHARLENWLETHSKEAELDGEVLQGNVTENGGGEKAGFEKQRQDREDKECMKQVHHNDSIIELEVNDYEESEEEVEDGEEERRKDSKAPLSARTPRFGATEVSVSQESEEILEVIEGGDDSEEKSDYTEEEEDDDEDDDDEKEGQKDEMRLQLGHDSDHESGDETARERHSAWNQEARNSSDEETSRGMWSKPNHQSVEDFFSNMDNGVTARPTQREAEDGEKVEESVEDTEGDMVSALPPPFANNPGSLLSKVDLADSLASSAQTNGWTLSSTEPGDTLAPAQGTSAYPYTLELAGTMAQSTKSYAGEGARPKVRHLLSNVDLESNASSQRPNSGSSHASRGSHGSRKSGGSRKSRSDSVASKNSSGSQKLQALGNTNSKNKNLSTQHTDDTTSSVGVLDQAIPDIESEKFVAVHPAPPTTSVTNHRAVTKFNDRDSTVDSAYVDWDSSEGHTTQPNSLMMVNGYRGSTEDLTPEDSGLGQGSVSQHSLVKNGDVSSMSQLPNFFMPDADMQASIRALQMATCAATNVNEAEVRAQSKVKAVSELVSKMAATTSAQTNPKVTQFSVKNKKPPSADEAKRIAKIFSSKMS